MPRTRAEIGAMGLPIFSGRIALDPNRKLRGAQAIQTYREMAHDEPAAAAVLGACNTLLRTDLGVTPGGDTDADQRAAAFVEECLDDMRDALGTTIRQANSSLWAGYSILEIVYKRRNGGSGSRYTDGKIGWAAWAYRRQDSFYQWQADTNGRVTAWIQRPAPDYVLRTIPLKKALHVVSDDSEGNPEGRSICRAMYRPWQFIKNLELLWGISLERFGTGVPVFEEVERISPLTDAQEQILRDIASGLRQNEEAFVKTPFGLKFRFEPSPGLDADNYRSAILFFRTWALATALAEFITLGTGDTGSFALGQAKIDLFYKALTGYQEKLVTAINRQIIPPLFRYNDFGELTALPEVTLPAVKEYDLAALGTFSQVLANIGAFHVTPEDEAHFRRISDLIDIDQQTLEQLHEEDKAQEAEQHAAQIAAITARAATGGEEADTEDSSDTPADEDVVPLARAMRHEIERDEHGRIRAMTDIPVPWSTNGHAVLAGGDDE